MNKVQNKYKSPMKSNEISYLLLMNKRGFKTMSVKNCGTHNIDYH